MNKQREKLIEEGVEIWNNFSWLPKTSSDQTKSLIVRRITDNILSQTDSEWVNKIHEHLENEKVMCGDYQEGHQYHYEFLCKLANIDLTPPSTNNKENEI